jgi:acetyltransferase-like isoleucine patch superfamily enzyme
MRKDYFLNDLNRLIRGFFRTLRPCFIGENVHIGSNPIINPMAYIGDNVSIGDNVILGNGSVIRSKSYIGNNCLIGHLTVLEGYVSIGDNVRIQAQSHIPKYTIIEDGVFIGPCFMAVNTNTITHMRAEKPFSKGPIIRRLARLGGNATLLPGVTIGENAYIGAGSVVTRDIPDNEMWIGNPARFLKIV